MCQSDLHSHHHHHDNKSILFGAFILTFLFALLEIIFSFISNSLALLSEGLHMLSDGTSLFISLVAVIVGSKAVSLTHNFGYRRIEVIAAFINGLTLIAIPMFILWESIERFKNPPAIDINQVIIIGIIGLIVNIVVAFLLHKGSEHSINIKSAYLHVFADLLSSVATIATGIIIHFTNFQLIDPIVSVIISFMIIRSGILITKQAFHILMERSPMSEDVYYLLADYVRENKLPFIEVKSWTITTHENHMLISFSTPINKEHREHILSIVNKNNGYNVSFSYIND